MVKPGLLFLSTNQFFQRILFVVHPVEQELSIVYPKCCVLWELLRSCVVEDLSLLQEQRVTFQGGNLIFICHGYVGCQWQSKLAIVLLLIFLLLALEVL